MERKNVFVTVGTTHFDALIKAVVDDETLEKLREKGYKEIVLQTGNGKFVPEQGVHRGVNITSFRLKASIAEDFAKADLVISHAGAGSCLEALEAGKPLVAVVNDTLMANHQVELAEELASREFCFFCYPSTLQSTLATLDISQLKKYEPGQPQLVADYLDKDTAVSHTFLRDLLASLFELNES
ncbi:UDP-N-acetylglucosamine transferase subunit ALG13 homolog [Macrobrachium nipponense]|uniref:UDP-N-acetylglucosamine transferase subunit ALG13 homolog n=1 Tax=Macrobrachium nipponense TaxID=159736 RepID=UPI0030C8355B